jgi:hypothetical protein
MGKRRDPTYCKHFPFCEPLKTLVGKLSLRLLDSYTSVLPMEAELICNQCSDFEQREMSSLTE